MKYKCKSCGRHYIIRRKLKDSCQCGGRLVQDDKIPKKEKRLFDIDRYTLPALAYTLEISHESILDLISIDKEGLESFLEKNNILPT